MLAHWDFGTRCVQMTTMHSAVLFLATNNNLPHLTLLVPWFRDLWILGETCEKQCPPTLGLDSRGLEPRIVEPFATSLLMIWHLGFARGRPTTDLFSPGLDIGLRLFLNSDQR